MGGARGDRLGGCGRQRLYPASNLRAHRSVAASIVGKRGRMADFRLINEVWERELVAARRAHPSGLGFP